LTKQTKIENYSKFNNLNKTDSWCFILKSSMYILIYTVSTEVVCLEHKKEHLLVASMRNQVFCLVCLLHH